MADITIVGAGLMGTAVAYPLSDNGHNVRLVGTHLDGEIIATCKEQGYHPRLKRKLPVGVVPYYYEEIGAAMEGVDIVVSGVNSLGAHWIGQAISPYVRPGLPIIAITKGLEMNTQGRLEILPDILASHLSGDLREQVHLAAVGGPCIAGELAARRQSCVVFGSRHREAVEALAVVFRTPYYHIWTTTDLVALEYCAALKNAYALSIGLVVGMLERAGGVDAAGAHFHNLAAAVFAQASTEIGRTLELTGVSRSFAYGLPGVGDLYVTSVGGRTVRFGSLLGAGYSYSEAREIMAGETLEAVEIIRTMGMVFPYYARRGEWCADDLPLMRTLIDIVVNGSPASLLADNFFGGCGQI